MAQFENITNVRIAEVLKKAGQMHEQLDKIAQKSQADVDLLDNMRLFFKDVVSVENEYSVGLTKHAQQALQRNKDAFAEVVENTGQPRLSTYVWMDVAQEHTHIASMHQKLASSISTEVLEPLKRLRTSRIASMKDTSEKFNIIKDELLQTVQNLDQIKKSYEEASKAAEHARKEYFDISERHELDHRKLFETKTAFEKKFQVSTQKFQDHTVTENNARNAYILAICAANEHVIYYYQVLLPKLLNEYNGSFHEDLKGVLKSYYGLRKALYDEGNKCVDQQLILCEQILKLYEQQVFFQENSLSYTQPAPFTFENLMFDEVKNIVVDDFSRADVQSELQKKMDIIASIDQQLADPTDPTKGENQDFALLSRAEKLHLQRLQARAQSTLMQSAIAAAGPDNTPAPAAVRTSFDEQDLPSGIESSL